MGLPTLNGLQVTVLVGLGIGLSAAAYYHNTLIDREIDLAADRFAAGIHVVIGTLYTLTTATIALSIIFGLESALWAMLVVFVCFMVSGGPMVFGELIRNAKRHNERQEAQRREQLTKELEYGDRG